MNIYIYVFIHICTLYVSFDLITHKSFFDNIIQVGIERLEQLGLIAVDHQVPDGSW